MAILQTSRAVVAALTSAVLCLLLVRPGMAASWFSDLETHWSASYVGPLAARGIVTGDPDGRFHPRRTVTRAEFIKMLVAALAEPLPQAVLRATSPRFVDVPSGHWARSFAEAAWELGWLEAGADRRFQPDRPMMRAEAISLLARAVGLVSNAAGSVGQSIVPFTDRDHMPAQVLAAAAASYAAGLVSGYPDGSFRPDAVLSRAEAAAVIARALAWQGGLYDLQGFVDGPIALGTDPSLVPVRLTSGARITLPVPGDAVIYRNGVPARIETLQPFDEIAIVLDDGKPRWLEAWFADAHGQLHSVRIEQRLLLFQDPSGAMHAATLAPGARVFLNGRPAALRDLRQGDLLYVTFTRDGQIRAVDAVRANLRGVVWGRQRDPDGVVRIRIGERYTASRWYRLADDAPVFIDGRRSSWSKLRIGDRAVVARDVSGAVVYLEVSRIAAPR